MMFRILIFYKTDEALDEYLKRFKLGVCDLEAYLMKKTKDDRLYTTGHMEILCKRGFSDRCRGYRCHFAAIQEDLTWCDNWDELRDTIIQPTLLSPIPVHIFDGISKEDIDERYKENRSDFQLPKDYCYNG